VIAHAARSEDAGTVQAALLMQAHQHPAIQTLVRLLSRQAAAERVRAASTSATNLMETLTHDQHE
jgi:hypothetical protein